MSLLDDKVAAIIGPAKARESIGDGRVSVLRFLQEAAGVLAVDRQLCSIQETVDMAANGEKAFDADMTDTGALKTKIDRARRNWAVPTYSSTTPASALARRYGPPEVMTDSSFDFVMQGNLRGAVMAAQLRQPIMRAQETSVVLDVSSMSAIETRTHNVPYRAGKAGMLAFTLQLALRNAEYSIRAKCDFPGRVETAMAVGTRARLSGTRCEEIIARRRKLIPLKNYVGTGRDIASAAMLLASDEVGLSRASPCRVDGGALVKIG